MMGREGMRASGTLSSLTRTARPIGSRESKEVAR